MKDTTAPPQPVFSRESKPINFDSGYHGSQISVATEVDEREQAPTAKKSSPTKISTSAELSDAMDVDSDERRTTEGSFQSAKEEQTLAMTIEEPILQQEVVPVPVEEQNLPVAPTHSVARKELPASPPKQSPHRPALSPQRQAEKYQDQQRPDTTEVFDDAQSPSEGSSPIRPIVVRKSSLNFASLPAREPLTTKKSIGNRTSRTSHIEQSRTSYYGRNTGGKSLGGVHRDQDEDENDESDVDMPDAREESEADSKLTRIHNKTYTQRLQDQISMLGQSQSQAPRPSKSVPNLAAMVPQPVYASSSQEPRKAASPFRVVNAPGAFPEDEDSWIGPPTAAAPIPSIFSPRPAMHAKSHSTDVMDGIHGKDSIGGSEFNVPKQRRDDPRHRSPLREPAIPERTTSTLGHAKSASTSIIKSPMKGDAASDYSLKKGISVSNPNIASMQENMDDPVTPKSPSRSYRESPLKAAKDKLSSILKTSKNLFVSSAAASAAAKGATLSPPPQRFGQHDAPSMEDVLYRQPTQNSLYPSLDDYSRNENQHRQDSPPKSPRKTRASTEREDKKKEKEAREAKEAQKMEQKLEKLREKESEKARQFSQQEHDRIAAMERQVIAKKEQERLAKAAQAEVPRATRSSPRKTKAQLEAEGRAAAAASYSDNGDRDIEMSDASATMGPPAMQRPGSQIGKPRDAMKRPVKPSEKLTGPSRQAHVVIRVDTGSQRGPRNPYHPSNASLATSLGESLSAPSLATVSAQVGRSVASSNQKPKTGAPTIRPKPSTSSLKSVSSNTGKVKALEVAAKKREEVRFWKGQKI